MRARRLLAFSACAVIGLAGCDAVRSVFTAGGDAADPRARDSGARDDQTAAVTAFDEAGAGQPGDTSGDPTPERRERTIEAPVVAESTTRSVVPGVSAETFAEASVPVLAPASMSRGQATQFAESYRATPEGYFARLSLEEFDVVVNGTRVYAVPPESAGAPPARDVSQYQFSESETGMSVTFNRFGADYSVDFVCRGAGGEEGSECVTEAEAAALLARLVPVGGGGR